MIVDVNVPGAGESVTEGLLAAWLKEDGEVVESGDDLYELETDKVTMTVPAIASGKLTITVVAGTMVEVDQTVGTIDTEAGPALSKDDSAPPSETAASPISAPAGLPQAEAKLGGGDFPLPPAVRRLVEQHQLDASQIAGTGKGGRINKGDALKHLEAKKEAMPEPKPAPLPPAPTVSAKCPVAQPAQTEAADSRETRVRMSPLRYRLTERLVEVQQTAAILSTFNEVDMTEVMALRAKYKESFVTRHGVKLGFMSFFVKGVVEALKSIPEINARIEGDEIIYQHYYDIGVAVGTERGLVVPIIRGAEQLSFAEIELQIADLAQRAHKRKLTLDDMTGGVFTISNGGVYGSLLSTPILNPPQSGILGMHGIKKRPVAIDDQVVIRPMMYLALSYDHRIVDGAQAVTFLKRIVECLEDPQRLLLEV